LFQIGADVEVVGGSHAFTSGKVSGNGGVERSGEVTVLTSNGAEVKARLGDLCCLDFDMESKSVRDATALAASAYMDYPWGDKDQQTLFTFVSRLTAPDSRFFSDHAGAPPPLSPFSLSPWTRLFNSYGGPAIPLRTHLHSSQVPLAARFCAEALSQVLTLVTAIHRMLGGEELASRKAPLNIHIPGADVVYEDNYGGDTKWKMVLQLLPGSFDLGICLVGPDVDGTIPARPPPVQVGGRSLRVWRVKKWYHQAYSELPAPDLVYCQNSGMVGSGWRCWGPSVELMKSEGLKMCVTNYDAPENDRTLETLLYHDLATAPQVVYCGRNTFPSIKIDYFEVNRAHPDSMQSHHPDGSTDLRCSIYSSNFFLICVDFAKHPAPVK